MSNLYLPGAAILLSLFLVILFFSKKRLKNDDTRIFQLMIIVQLFESIIETLIYVICYKYSSNIELIKFLNSFTCSLYILWVWLFFRYIFYIAYQEKHHNRLEILKKIEIIVNVIAIILIFLSPINIMNENGIMYGYGMKANITYIVCGMWIFFAILMTIYNIKNINNKKYMPLWTLFMIAALIFIIRSFDPSIIVIPFALTFINLVMYHSIENPDVKMINELELAKSQAEKANRAKSDFLSSMSHEIRTPLNAIVCLSEIISNSDDLKEIHEDSKDVVNASHTLLDIVNGVLDISRIEADKMEIVNIDYNPIEEFEELSKLIEARIGDKDIELRTNFAIDIPNYLNGDRGKIKQIITNLLTNAVKYTEKGFVDFDVKCINKGNVCKLAISVKDTGRGIKKDQIDKLFTKFNRLDEDKNTTIEGTGLGLAITKSLIELMGGKIVVDSTYGEGSKFSVFVEQKIVNENSIVEEKNTNKNNTNFNDKKVLVVDDNKLNLRVASKIFKEFGITIEEASSGYECIDKIENGEVYDIIFMDIMMPKMSGVEAFKKLKQLDNFNIPVIALTADAMEGSFNKYMEVGFNDCITKPINKERLNDVLNNILNSNSKKTNIDSKIDKKLSITDEDIKKFDVLNDKKEEYNSNERGNMNYLKQNDIDVDASLELLGDIEMYNDTLNTFIEENKERIPRIEKNKNEGNMKDYSIDVHALKSDSKYLGFKKLAELSYDHELKSKDNNIDYINNHYEELINEYNRIYEVINKYLGK